MIGAGARWRGRGAALAFGVAVALIVGEALLRLLGFSHPLLVTADAGRGYAWRPGAAGRWRVEGDVDVRINSLGMHDVERTRLRTPGVARVALLGDSFAAGLQVPRAAGFAAGLEASACGPLEVLNFGVNGYGTGQELRTWTRVARGFQPDVSMLLFFTGNDVADNAPWRDGTGPRFSLVDRQLVDDDSFLRTRRYRFRASRTFRVVEAASDRLRLLQLVEATREHRRSRRDRRGTIVEGFALEAGDRRAHVYASGVPAWEDAWAVTTALLDAWAAAARADGATPLLVLAAAPEVVHPDRARVDRFRAALGVPDLAGPARRLEAWALDRGVALVDTAPALAATGALTHHLAGTGHWNSLGHATAVAAVAPQLCRILADRAAGAGGEPADAHR